jgi:type II secretory pathway pseudopilin PulG
MNVTAMNRTRARGFTYVGLLIAVVILGLALSQVGVVWRTQAQREREQELLDIGHDFQAAIASYYASGGHQYPQDVADLLNDTRGPVPRHHLRRFHADPMTGAQDWTLFRNDQVGITGIASSSPGKPIKVDGFRPDEEGFKDASSYADWKFVFVGRNIRRRATQTPPAAD